VAFSELKLHITHPAAAIEKEREGGRDRDGP